MDTIEQRSVNRLGRIRNPRRNARTGNGFYIGLEGPDGVGKTTVANILSEQLGIPVFHRHPPLFGYDPKISMGMEYAALKLYDDHGFSMIEERTFFGFAVYKNNHFFTADILRAFVGLVTRRRRYAYAFLDAPTDVIKSRLAEKGEIVPSIEEDADKYRTFFSEEVPAYFGDMNIHRIDASRNPKQIAKEVLRLL